MKDLPEEGTGSSFYKRFDCWCGIWKKHFIEFSVNTKSDDMAKLYIWVRCTSCGRSRVYPVTVYDDNVRVI